MERGVEDRHLRYVWQHTLNRLDALQIDGIVQRSKLSEAFDDALDDRSDHCRLSIFLSTMNDTMADDVDLCELAEHLRFPTDKRVEHVLDDFPPGVRWKFLCHCFAMNSRHLQVRLPPVFSPVGLRLPEWPGRLLWKFFSQFIQLAFLAT